MDALKFLNQAHWDYRLTHEGISIKAPTRQAAESFAAKYEEVLLTTAMKLKGRVRVGWHRCKHPLEFHGWMMAANTPAPHETAEAILSNDGKVFSTINHLPIPLLKRMVAAGESELPWSITRHSDNRLVILNTPMENLIATPKALATQRIVSDFWRPADFAELQHRYRVYGRFSWHYDAALNTATWADLQTDFERFEATPGEWYGQNIIRSAESIPFPEDVLLAV